VLGADRQIAGVPPRAGAGAPREENARFNQMGLAMFKKTAAQVRTVARTDMKVRWGLDHVAFARHVVKCHSIQESRVQIALDDAASKLFATS